MGRVWAHCWCICGHTGVVCHHQHNHQRCQRVMGWSRHGDVVVCWWLRGLGRANNNTAGLNKNSPRVVKWVKWVSPPGPRHPPSAQSQWRAMSGEEVYDVVVVGAGLAGLMAATTLQDAWRARAGAGTGVGHTSAAGAGCTTGSALSAGCATAAAVRTGTGGGATTGATGPTVGPAIGTGKSYAPRLLVVEARPRVGGRVLTADIGGGHIDLGAAWIRECAARACSTRGRCHWYSGAAYHGPRVRASHIPCLHHMAAVPWRRACVCGVCARARA